MNDKAFSKEQQAEGEATQENVAMILAEVMPGLENGEHSKEICRQIFSARENPSTMPDIVDSLLPFAERLLGERAKGIEDFPGKFRQAVVSRWESLHMAL